MSPDSVLRDPWFERSGPQAVQGLIELADRYQRDWQWRREMARRLAARYHGRDPAHVDVGRDSSNRIVWDVDGLADGSCPLIQNQYNQYTETFVSKIGAIDAPKTALTVTDGEWSTKQKAINCSRRLEAEMGMRQGVYANVYKLAEQALRIAYACTGSVAAKIYPWPNEKRVVVELHDTLDMFLDDTELTYGAPLTYGEVTWWNPHVLKHRFPGLKDSDIQLEAPTNRAGLTFTGRTLQTQLVPVWEGWKVRQGDTMGRHVAGLRNGTVLVDEEWEYDEPPFAFLHLMPRIYGFWACPPLDLVDEEILRSNEILAFCDEAERDTPKQVHYVHEGSIVDEGELVETRTLKYVRTKTPGYQPAMSTPAPFDRLALELKDRHDQAIAKVLGIDEMHVAARREPGLDSGVAQREAAQRFDSRFASQHRAYIQFVAVDIARHMLRAHKRLAEAGALTERAWKGENFTRKVDPDSIVDLDIDALQIAARPISEVKNTPQERVQYAQELLDRGAITIEQFISIQQTYDTPGETKVVRSQRRWIAAQIDKWLMDDLDEIEYQGPRPWIRTSDALVQVVDALQEAEIDEVPQERLDYFLNFIAELAPLSTAASTGVPGVASTATAPFNSAAGMPAGGAPGGAPALPAPAPVPNMAAPGGAVPGMPMA